MCLEMPQVSQVTRVPVLSDASGESLVTRVTVLSDASGESLVTRVPVLSVRGQRPRFLCLAVPQVGVRAVSAHLKLG